MSDRRPTDVRPPVPGWVKLLGLVFAAAVVVTIAVSLLAGAEHGPGRHTPGGDGDRHTPGMHENS